MESTEAHLSPTPQAAEITELLRRFLADPRLTIVEKTETLYLLENEKASIGIRFDEHNVCTGDVMYEGTSTTSLDFELDKDEIELVCEYINTHEAT